ncbi:MAG: Nramp family divalent metal transporter [Planctomycetales bacterium]|nr:Nramp family divalent metal transporter [Planctomycetales bacterium]
MAQEEIVYPPLSDDLRGRLNWRALKYFGAGAIMASVTIGSGETVFASRSGAVFGYSLMWCFIGGALMKGVQVYVGGRHMVLTGEHPMAHWAQLPGPKNWVPVVMGLLSIGSFPFWLAGLPLMLAQCINWILGIDVQVLGMTPSEFKELAKTFAPDDPRLLELQTLNDKLFFIQRSWATLAILVAVTLTCLQSYQLLERAQLVIVGILLSSLLIACMASGPDWGAAIAGFVPSSPQYAQWVYAYDDIVKDSEWAFICICLGAIGGGTYDYLGYLGCYREKTWGALGRARALDPSTAETLRIDTDQQNLGRARGWLIPVKIDVGVSFVAVVVFTSCFIVLGAIILHPDQDVPDKFALLSKQARFLTDFHPTLVYLYQIGIFMAIWGTIYGGYEIYLRTAYECVAPVSRRLRRSSGKMFRHATLAYCAGGALLLVWWGGDDPADMVKPAAIIGGVLTCGLWCFAMIWTDRRFLPKPLQMGPVLLLLTIFSGTFLTGLGLLVVWQEYLSRIWGS